MLPARFPARHPKQIISIALVLAGVFFFLSATFRKSHVTQPTSVTVGGEASAKDVAELCKNNGFKPWRSAAGNTHRRVYDMFLISTELDWLEIRLHTLAPYVDYFIIVESPTTFTGLSKPLSLQDAWGNFTEFHDRIIHRVVQDPGPSIGMRAWDHEHYLRNSLIDAVFPSLIGTPQEVQAGDVLVVGDIDEIARPETIVTLRHCEFPPRLTLRSQFYYYSYQWRHHGSQWAHPQATFYAGEQTVSPQDLRSGVGGTGSFFFTRWLQRWRQKADLWNAAWHCSSCFATLEEMRTKMQSFSHTPWNTPENREPATIVQRVQNGLDLFARKGENYDRVEGNLDVPRYILEHETTFTYMLNRDGEGAAFQDWEKIKGG